MGARLGFPQGIRAWRFLCVLFCLHAVRAFSGEAVSPPFDLDTTYLISTPGDGVSAAFDLNTIGIRLNCGEGISDAFDLDTRGVHPVELTVAPVRWGVSWKEGTAGILVSVGDGGSVAWSASVVSGASWLSVVPPGSGTGDGSFSVSFGTNPAAAKRVGTVRVTGPGASATVTVEQGGKVAPPTDPYEPPDIPRAVEHLQVWDRGAFRPATTPLPTNKPVYVIAHGWDALWLCQSLHVFCGSDWMAQMAADIASAVPGSVVFRWNWIAQSGGVLPPTTEAMRQGATLGKVLVENGASNAPSVHFIGFSLGSAVCTQAALKVGAVPGRRATLRLTILDPPESGLAYFSEIWRESGRVLLSEPLRQLAEDGVVTDNYVTQFGRTYDYATNIWLRDAAYAGKGSLRPIGNHALAPEWYIGTIRPDVEQWPGGALFDYFLIFWLSDYLPGVDGLTELWEGVESAGFGQPSFLNGSVWRPARFVLNEASMLAINVGYYPFSLLRDTFKTEVGFDPVYMTLVDDLLTDGTMWEGEGTAYTLDGEMHMLTDISCYVFREIAVPTKAGALRFDYRFDQIKPGDQLVALMDGVPISVVEPAQSEAGVRQTSAWLDISGWAAKEARLAFSLSRVGAPKEDQPAQLAINRIEIAQEVESYWNEDPDEDGLRNYDELIAGTRDDIHDSDEDGIPDGWEFTNGLNPLDSVEALPDADNDGLSYADEFLLGTNPNNPDTDGDGISDGDEVANGTDPLTPEGGEGEGEGEPAGCFGGTPNRGEACHYPSWGDILPVVVTVVLLLLCKRRRVVP